MASFAAWLSDYFKRLPHELDGEVLGDYVTGVLDESSGLDSTELRSEIAELLAAYLPNDVAHDASTAIVDRYFSPTVDSQHPDDPKISAATNGDVEPSLEDRMRSLLIAERERLNLASLSPSVSTEAGAKKACDDGTTRGNRDACTLAVLREAGVCGYQSNSDDERSLEIALANADFRARQRLTAGVSADVTLVDGAEEDDVVGGDASLPDAVEVDMEELEELSGYGRKPEAKPGTVADALAELDCRCPQTTRPLPPNGLVGPAPMTFNLSGFAASSRVPPDGQLANGFSATALTPGSKPDTGGQQQQRQRRGKKVHVTVPKHIARVGAQAEADSRRKQPGASAVNRVSARRDEMDAFLFSDDDDGDGGQKSSCLPEGGRNHERVLAAESVKRQVAANEAAERRAKDKAERNRQLTEAADRRQAAQKRAQKLERRR